MTLAPPTVVGMRKTAIRLCLLLLAILGFVLWLPAAIFVIAVTRFAYKTPTQETLKDLGAHFKGYVKDWTAAWRAPLEDADGV